MYLLWNLVILSWLVSLHLRLLKLKQPTRRLRLAATLSQNMWLSLKMLEIWSLKYWCWMLPKDRLFKKFWVILSWVILFLKPSPEVPWLVLLPKTLLINILKLRLLRQTQSAANYLKSQAPVLSTKLARRILKNSLIWSQWARRVLVQSLRTLGRVALTSEHLLKI